MLASLRPKSQAYADRSPSSPYSIRNPFEDQTGSRRLQNVDEEQMTEHREEDEVEDEDEDEDVQETSPLLPIFSASHLGMALRRSIQTRSKRKKTNE